MIKYTWTAFLFTWCVDFFILIPPSSSIHFPPTKSIRIRKKMSSMEGEIRNLAHVWLTATACLCYCRLISANLANGKWRLLSLLPIFSVFAILPLYTASAFFTAVSAFFFTWLANFKLLLFAFDRGPLASDPPKSLPVFVAIAALPFKIKPQNDAVKRSKVLPLYLATEIPISVVIIALLYDYRDRIHPQFVLLAYCCLIFLMIEILVGLSSLLVRALLGVELEPASDEPYLSTSLRQFWGKRWNLTVNSVLRETIFEPVRSAATGVLGRDMAAVAGVLATFLVSGLMHELLFWYVNRAGPSWEMTMFFVVHGVGVVVEYFGMKVKKRRAPWFVAAPVTVGFVVGTSFWLFFPPVVRNGADARVLEELRFAGEVVKEKMKEVWVHVTVRQQ